MFISKGFTVYKYEIAIIKKGNIQKETRIKKGDRQGCTLSSPLRFNANNQQAMNTIKYWMNKNGYRINMLRFSDNTAIIAKSKKDSSWNQRRSSGNGFREKILEKKY